MLKTPDEWYECLAWGKECISRPYEMADLREAGLPILHVYCLPSFINAKGWTIYQSGYGKNATFTLHMVLWRQPEDGKRIHEATKPGNEPASPEPTIEVFSITLGASWLNQQRQKLEKIRLPLLTERESGLDGTSYGISVPDRFAVEWWNNGPTEWHELITWTKECMLFFDQLLPEENWNA